MQLLKPPCPGATRQGVAPTPPGGWQPPHSSGWSSSIRSIYVSIDSDDKKRLYERKKNFDSNSKYHELINKKLLGEISVDEQQEIDNYRENLSRENSIEGNKKMPKLNPKFLTLDYQSTRRL